MWTDSVDAVEALGQLRGSVRAAKSIDAQLSKDICRARNLGVPVSVIAAEVGVNRATLYRQFGYHKSVAS